MSLSSQIDPEIFRAYDIRGEVGPQINPEVVRTIARAYGSRFPDPVRATVVVGRDIRESSEELCQAAVEGLMSCGCRVIDIGPCPTPIVYFAIGLWQADGGMGITASHRPPQYNGIKVRWGEWPFYGDQLQELYQQVVSGEFAHGEGSYEERDVWPEYFDIAAAQVPGDCSLRVVLDVGNGCGTFNAPRLLEAIGCQVDVLFPEPDGTFPGRGPDPLSEEAMTQCARRVVETGADLGIAIDADGDRVSIVDDTGTMVWPDNYVIPLCHEVLAKGPATIVTEVRCSQATIDQVEQWGGEIEMVACGYPFILDGMRRLDSPLGFETSGHCYFGNPYIKFDDAAYAAARLVVSLSGPDRTLREIVAELPKYFPAPEQRLDCPEERKADVVEAVTASYRDEYPVLEVDGARVQMRDGWALIRASNTAEELVMRWEGNTPAVTVIKALHCVQGELLWAR